MINVPKETRGTIRELGYFKDLSRQSGNLRQSRILCQQSFLQKKYVKARTLKTGFSVRKRIHLGIIRLSVNEQTVYGCKPV